MNRRQWFRKATGTAVAVAGVGVMITPNKPKDTVLAMPIPMCAVCNWQMNTLIRRTTERGCVDASCTNTKCSEGGIWKQIRLAGVPTLEVERADS